jgi:hypothetical protein
MQERAPFISFVPINYIILNLNKPCIMGNGGQLTYLDYLPTKKKMHNISRMQMYEPLISSGPLGYTRIPFKKALSDGE